MRVRVWLGRDSENKSFSVFLVVGICAVDVVLSRVEDDIYFSAALRTPNFD